MRRGSLFRLLLALLPVRRPFFLSPPSMLAGGGDSTKRSKADAECACRRSVLRFWFAGRRPR
jgi:hypothetical protein